MSLAGHARDFGIRALQGIRSLISKVVFSTESFPIVLSLSVMAILFVLVRMKGVEQDYRYNDVSKKIKKAAYDNKELKAKKAKLLSIKNLRELAKSYNLEEPKQDQIIIVP